MKKTLLTLVFVLIAMTASFAIDSTRFYILPSVSLVPKTGQTAVVVGGSFAYSPVHRLYVGGTFQNVVNRFMPLTEDDVRKELTSRWGGVKVDYQFYNRTSISAYGHVASGLGVLDIIIQEEGALPDEQEVYSFLQLGLNVDVPLHPNLALTLGWQYRFISEIEYKNVEASDIGGISAQLGVRYLIFK